MVGMLRRSKTILRHNNFIAIYDKGYHTGSEFAYVKRLKIDVYDTESLKEIYPIEVTDYKIWGKMKADIFLSLIDCLKNSKSVKRKYQKLL